jgi:protein gp37
MSDLFHDDVPEDFIADVFRSMRSASLHTYQVLTKRPGRMSSLLNRWQGSSNLTGLVDLPNVWLGTSVENQRWAEIRIPKLATTPSSVRFLSCEPLLGPIDLRALLGDALEQLHWVIVGGESGPRHRPMDSAWARSLRDQCEEAGVPYFFKQWGGRTPKAGGRELDGRTWDAMPERELAAL